jgi:CTP synthase (UTP-ammonia lyase)
MPEREGWKPCGPEAPALDAVVAAADAPSVYDIPKVLHCEGLDAYVVRRLGLPFRDVDWSDHHGGGEHP